MVFFLSLSSLQLSSCYKLYPRSQLEQIIVDLNSAYGEQGFYRVFKIGSHKENNELTSFTMIGDFWIKETACTAAANYKLGLHFC